MFKNRLTYPVRYWLWVFCVAFMVLPAAHAQQHSSFVHSVSGDSIIVRKTFPLLSLLQRDEYLKRVIKADIVFQKSKRLYQNRVTEAVRQCSDVSCYTAALQWKPDEIKTVGNEFVNLYQNNKRFKRSLQALKKEGAYNVYETLADTTWLRNAWNDAAKGMNYILNVYIKGTPPQYPKIDAISFQPGDTAFSHRVQHSISLLLRNKAPDLFFELPLQAALDALTINGRDEAARYEPLSGGLNALPFSAIQNVNWPAYKYSMILVPGLGPETPDIALDPGGAKRCEQAVLRFRKGLAPFIVVSGGHVHPDKTPYCEAVEMKKYLVEKLGIPDNAVFIEPHARHTTTNIRNVSRMIYRFGIPAAIPVLIVTDSSQNNYIVQRMEKTALRDLGYIPYQQLKQLSEQETEFYPTLHSLQPNPFDPLDP